MKPVLRLLALLLLLAFAAAPAIAAGKRKQTRLLEQTQNAYAAAIRWGEFEQAWKLVDPAHQAQHPLGELELERYRQVQVTGYTPAALEADADGGVARAVELRVVNKHTMAERTLRYRERWRWDEATRRWWLADGLPDLWKGE
jgi:hypothetical protein